MNAEAEAKPFFPGGAADSYGRCLAKADGMLLHSNPQ